MNERPYNFDNIKECLRTMNASSEKRYIRLKDTTNYKNQILLFHCWFTWGNKNQAGLSALVEDREGNILIINKKQNIQFVTANNNVKQNKNLLNEEQ